MKVLMTTDTLGGVWTYTLELARDLGHRGVEVAVATMGSPLTRAQRKQASELQNCSFYESRYKLEWMQNCWRDAERAGEWLLELERRLEPDVIHLNGYVHGALRWRTPVLVVAHSCVLSWWRAVHGCDAPAEWTEYSKRVRLGLRSADYVVAPTEAMLACVREHYGVSAPTAVISNARSLARFSPGEKRRFVLSAGRVWDKAKNIRAVERAAENLACPVYVAGDYAHPEGKETYRPRNVRHLGALQPEALAVWYSAASVYALPAFYEPFGLSVLEAALSGCALVLSDISSLVEIWEGAALFVPPTDVQALADSINMLMEDDSLRQLLAHKARARASRFTAQRMGEAYQRLYTELVAAAKSQEGGELIPA
jgi:glycogen synthase